MHKTPLSFFSFLFQGPRQFAVHFAPPNRLFSSFFFRETPYANLPNLPYLSARLPPTNFHRQRLQTVRPGLPLGIRKSKGFQKKDLACYLSFPRFR